MQLRGAIRLLVQPLLSFKISKYSLFLGQPQNFKMSYLGFYWAHSAQPMPAILFFIILSKNNLLVHISGLEKKFCAKIAKIGYLKPPRYNFFLKFFRFLNACSSCLWGSIGFFVGFLVFKQKNFFQKIYVMPHFHLPFIPEMKGSLKGIGCDQIKI